jgi:CHAT domain-containing protein
MVAEFAPVTPEFDTEDATPAVSRFVVIRGVAAAAAVIAVLALPALLGPWLERDAGLVSLAGSVGEHRSVLGRLTGGFPHAPLLAPSAGGQDGQAAGTDRVLLTSGRIRESFGGLEAPSRLHALGVANLLSRRYDDAAQLLLAASREQPANARYLNDVATVHLERARLGLRPDDLPRALAAAERATRLDPSLREAWFNRALAVTALSLTDQARAAWTEYLRRDATSPWAGEARARLEELSKPTPAAAWEAMAARLEQSIDAATADAAVRAHTTEARNWIEHELFVDWADAVSAGNDGGTKLEGARVMAESMLRVAGDAMYRDAIGSVDRAGAAQAAQFAAAYRAYATAAALVANDAFTDALPAMTQAHQRLAALNSPVSQLASIGLGTIAYVRAQYDDAERILAPIATGGHSYAAARANWFRGLIAFAQGRMGEAQGLYEDSLSTFERMGDVEQAGAVHTNLSGVAYQLGDTITEWRHRRAALDALTVTTSTRLKYLTLVPTAVSARAESPEAALAIQEGIIAVARDSGRQAAIVDALAQRAATLFLLGRSSDAEASAAEARNSLSRITDPAFRSILELPVLAIESDLARGANPQLAAASASRAIQIAAERGDRSRLPQMQLRLAKAAIASDRLDQAERALAAGIDAFDATRGQSAGLTGISTLDESWQLFETAVQLAIRRGDYERAFAMAERGRAQLPEGARQQLQVPTLAEVQQTLREGEAVIALTQFDDELAVWAIRNHGSHVVRLPLRKADARRLVARQQDEIRLQAAPTSALYDAIIRPVMSQLSGATYVSFVPDATYRDVSFAALWDRSTNRFAVEHWTLSAAPSVTALRASRGNAVTTDDLTPALVLSADADDTRFKTIADQYRSAEVITGTNATRLRLLGGAPVMHVAAPSYRNELYPSLSRLVLNDEPGRRYSGAVMSDEIARRPMTTTRLVVLDEIRARQSYRTAGSFDLATAFLAAGVPAVLGTLPGADESATRELMVGFHREVAGQASAAEALSRVQRNALKQNGGRLGAWTALVIYGSDR